MWNIDQARDQPGRRTKTEPIRVGFVPLCDAAPLIVAEEAGLFRRRGLDVELVREVGWATIRDKITTGHLDAAHALAAMPFAATLGMGSPSCDSLTGLVLNLQGNAVSLALRYWKEGVRDAASFGEFVRREKPGKPLVFGIVSAVSSHRLLMERWLTRAGLIVERDYELIVVPPPHVPDLLQAEHLAGFCVGEPWNSVAIERGMAWSSATSADLAPNHIEKVLFATEQFVSRRADEHLRLIASVLEACALCANPKNHEDISNLLSQRQYVNAPADLIRRSFSGAFLHGPGTIRYCPEFTVYHRGDSNVPTFERGAWVLEHLVPSAGPADPAEREAMVHKVFRQDLFKLAAQLNSDAEPLKSTETNTALNPAYA